MIYIWQFDEVFDEQDPTEGLKKLVDPRLGDNYPIDSVSKVWVITKHKHFLYFWFKKLRPFFFLQMAQLGKACTESNPQQRPNMSSVVVTLTALTSTSEDWDIASIIENPTLANLMSGK